MQLNFGNYIMTISQLQSGSFRGATELQLVFVSTWGGLFLYVVGVLDLAIGGGSVLNFISTDAQCMRRYASRPIVSKTV